MPAIQQVFQDAGIILQELYITTNGAGTITVPVGASGVYFQMQTVTNAIVSFLAAPGSAATGAGINIAPAINTANFTGAPIFIPFSQKQHPTIYYHTSGASGLRVVFVAPCSGVAGR